MALCSYGRSQLGAGINDNGMVQYPTTTLSQGCMGSTCMRSTGPLERSSRTRNMLSPTVATDEEEDGHTYYVDGDALRPV